MDRELRRRRRLAQVRYQVRLRARRQMAKTREVLAAIDEREKLQCLKLKP